jgi:hypothetical protein
MPDGLPTFNHTHQSNSETTPNPTSRAGDRKPSPQTNNPSNVPESGERERVLAVLHGACCAYFETKRWEHENEFKRKNLKGIFTLGTVHCSVTNVNWCTVPLQMLTPKGPRPFLKFGQAIVNAIFVKKISNFW